MGLKSRQAFIIIRLISIILVLTYLWEVLPTRHSVMAAGNSDRIIVSLGDSYSSGEGLGDYYGEELPLEERVQNEDWLAHRSHLSWPGRLTLDGVYGTMEQNRGTSDVQGHWYFAAISGATTEGVLGKNTFDEGAHSDKSPHIEGTTCKEYYKTLGGMGRHDIIQPYSGVVDLENELSVFNQIGEGRTVDYVTITLGGNDALFGKVMEAVIMPDYTHPTKLQKLVDDIERDFDKENGIRDNLKKTYKAIAEKAPSSTIIVVGYPYLVDEHKILGNFLDITEDEDAIVDYAVRFMDEKLADLVAECQQEGMNIIYVSLEKASTGHGAYSQRDEPYINGLILLSKAQDLIDHDLYSAGSFHPNEKGAEMYRALVQDAIDQEERKKKSYLEEIVVDADISGLSLQISSDLVSVHIPSININSESINNINREIQETLLETRERYDRFEDGCVGVNYHWYVNGDLLSIVAELYADPTIYKAYNISLEKECLLDSTSVISSVGWTQDEYSAQLDLGLGTRFWDISGGAIAMGEDLAMYEELLMNTISENNTRSAQPFVNGNGHLCIIANVGVFAGMGWIEQVIDLVDDAKEYQRYVVEPYSGTSDIPSLTSTYWFWGQGVTNGSLSVVKFSSDGHYEARNMGGYSEAGTYSLAAGILTMNGEDYRVVDGAYQSLEQHASQSAYIWKTLTPIDDETTISMYWGQ